MSSDTLSPWPKATPPAETLCGEDERLAVIASFGLEHFSGDEELERITRFAAQLCGTPIATVSLVEAERQRFLAREGLEESETPRSTSFCAHTMLQGEILEVCDATEDEQFSGFELVRSGLKLRYYAGAPLISSEGAPLGALCVIDVVPRAEPMTALQREGLEVLASAVMRRLEERRHRILAASELEGSEERFRLLADSIPDIVWTADTEGNFNYFNRRWYEFFGVDDRPQDGWTQYFHPEDHSRWFETWQKARESGEVYETEYRLRGGDGNYRWVLARGLPLQDANGKVVQWFGTITDIDDTYRESEARDLLARELAHRIKNVFSIISSLLTLRTRGKPELAVFAKEMDQAIRALAQAQDYVMPIRSEEDQKLLSLLELLLSPYGKANGQMISITGASPQIGPRSATPLALIVHELATNATKYGALSAAQGRVQITIGEAGSDIIIEWRESGGPRVEEPSNQGFGTRLLKTTIENQLGGSLERVWQSKGLCCTITVPKSHLQE